MSQSRFGTHRLIPACSLLAVVLVAALAGCGGSSAPSPTSSTSTSTSGSTSSATTGSTTGSSASSPATVSTRSVSGLGPVLVNAQGSTLYIFEPDAHARVTCTGSCAQVWPPLKLANGGHPSASGAAKSSLLGSDPDPEGGHVVTYAGWPLYTYAGDSGPGNASGQGLDSNGGAWYAIAPSGRPVMGTP